MRVKITKPVMVECLEGSIVEMTERQYSLAMKYCEPIVEEPVIVIEKREIPEKVIEQKKQTRKGKK